MRRELVCYGLLESTHIRHFKPVFYRHKEETLFGYGIKFFPDVRTLKPANPHLEEFAGL